MNNYPCVLTIAGSDSSGGAGIQADIKAISMTGSYAASIITAITAQNTLGVQGVMAIPKEMVLQQLDSVLSDLDIKAIKIGMLFNEDIINVVCDSISRYKIKNIVLDPVMMAKSEDVLLESVALSCLQTRLFPLCDLITPNKMEAERLLGREISDIANMQQAAQDLSVRYQTNVLVKGGHMQGVNATDILYVLAEAKFIPFTSHFINSKNTHGTGCTLSAAIASYLAQDYKLEEAISHAKNYVSNAIKASQNQNIGKGSGPVDHFYKLNKLN